MTVIDEFVNSGKFKKSNIKKSDLDEFVSNSLTQILEINEAYKKVFQGSEDSVAYISEIESKLNEIRNKYVEYFEANNEASSKIVELDSKIEEISNYHAQLLKSDESISNAIQKSQERITDFYNFLFKAEEGQENNDVKVKEAIQNIIEFNSKLTSKDGLQQAINEAHSVITKKYEELYNPDENGDTKIQKLDESISDILKFNDEVTRDIGPEINDRRAKIGTMMDEVASLLSDATARTLAQGYLESMYEYSKKNKIYHKDKNGEVINSKFTVFVHNLVRHIPQIMNYILFIVPLIVASGVYLHLVQDLGSNPSIGLSVTKFLATLPVLWLSWFGQKNISERKRLFEEYNHKLRVVQMYLMFTNQDRNAPTYKLDDMSSLEKQLIEVIGRNPSETFGRDETMLDKIFKLIEVGYANTEKRVGSIIDSVNTEK